MLTSFDPTNIYLFKVCNRNTRKRNLICPKLTIKTPERRCLHHSGIFLVNFEHNSNHFLVFLLLTYTVYVQRRPAKWRVTARGELRFMTSYLELMFLDSHTT